MAASDQNDSDFKKAMADVTPIKYDKLSPTPPNKLKAMPRRVNQAQSVFNNTEPNHYFSVDHEAVPVGNEEVLEYRAGGIQKRKFDKLRKGQLPIESELDLHGMTTDEAADELALFLRQCLDDNSRCVLMIHGKGYRSAQQSPVLKTRLNSWLRQCRDVLAFCSALPRDGGTGAVYVLLRKSAER